MKISPYTSLKPAWHLEKIDALRDGQTIAPAQVQIILSDLCNHDCSFCAYRMTGGFSTEQFAGPKGERNPNRMIPTGKAIEIIDDLHEIGIPAIQFTGGGEPTVHPEHLHIFDYALSKGRECALVTNGARLRNGALDILPRFSWLRISLDAGNAASYAKIRNVKNTVFSRVLSNIRALRLAIDDGRTGCILGVSYVVTKDNWGEIPNAARIVRDAGAHYVRFAAMWSEEGHKYYAGFYNKVQGALEEAKEHYVHNGFGIVDMFGGRVDDLMLGQPDYERCAYQQFNVYVAGNLKVYRCCTTSYTALGQVGDLSKQRFRDWFDSDERRQAYQSFSARECHHCPFNDKNRAINYLVDDNPLHVNFV